MAFLLAPAVLVGFCLNWLVREQQPARWGEGRGRSPQLRGGGMWWHRVVGSSWVGFAVLWNCCSVPFLGLKHNFLVQLMPSFSWKVSECCLNMKHLSLRHFSVASLKPFVYLAFCGVNWLKYEIFWILLHLGLWRVSHNQLPGAGEGCSSMDSFPLLLAIALFSLLRKLLLIELCNNNSL